MTALLRRPAAARAAWSQGLRRIAAATPAGRDRSIDALRAVAIVGVVTGHWLVSAIVADPTVPGRLTGASPLSTLPALTPVSWLLQTLGPFFVAGGFAAARSLGDRPPARWLASRLPRLLRPVLVLAVVWIPAQLLLLAAQAPAATRHTVLSLVSHPLWFMGVYLALTALTPLLRRAVHALGWTAALVPLAVVACTDLYRSAGLPLAAQLAAVLAGWSVPYLLGIALAEGRLGGRRAGAVLLGAGVAAGALLVDVAGYPASAVGVPGDGWSNLDPPSLFAMALAAAQLGVFLLVRPWLARLLRRRACWAPVAGLNLVAVTVFCWHQSALLVLTFAGTLAGPLPGLLDQPSSPAWVLYRLAWFPLLATILVILVVVFRRAERWRGSAARGHRRQQLGQAGTGQLEATVDGQVAGRQPRAGAVPGGVGQRQVPAAGPGDQQPAGRHIPRVDAGGVRDPGATGGDVGQGEGGGAEPAYRTELPQQRDMPGVRGGGPVRVLQRGSVGE